MEAEVRETGGECSHQVVLLESTFAKPRISALALQVNPNSEVEHESHARLPGGEKVSQWSLYSPKSVLD